MTPTETPTRILVVDDDPDILQLFGEIFRNANAFPNETVLETDPKAALERVETTPIDLVISDYKMPGMDGVDLLLQVKARHPSALRILMTAHSTKQAALAAILTAEVHSYIEKPFDPAEVLRTVREAVDQRRAPVEGLTGFVGASDRALSLVAELCKRMEDAPPEARELALTLEFPSTTDFNHFAARAFEQRAAEVRDIHFEDGKFIVTIACLAHDAGAVLPGAGEVPRGSARRRRPSG
ncbi:MAG: response regulator [Euryarchaeota archaeon]|nr:response regulator [Euryarchaeota archaeon]MDE1835466.1 response regulator [Euryarchaeota archaeon]MDE1881406.1 response regulator [Euryarchaeota archaeon]MDE2045747.1 response regulator [Thermoplasmata archaeon]